MNYTQKIIDIVKPRFTRPYKGGVELRGLDLDHVRYEVARIIEKNAYPVEIFEVDVRTKSISIREISQEQ